MWTQSDDIAQGQEALNTQKSNKVSLWLIVIESQTVDEDGPVVYPANTFDSRLRGD